LNGSNSFEGNKAMAATARGLFIGGDGQMQGGVRTGPGAVYDFNNETYPPAPPPTTITAPLQGPGLPNNPPYTLTGNPRAPTSAPYTLTGTARVATGAPGRVEVSVRDRDSGQYLQDNGSAFTTFGNGANTLNAPMTGTGTTRTWSLPMSVTVNRNLLITATT